MDSSDHRPVPHSTCLPARRQAPQRACPPGHPDRGARAADRRRVRGDAPRARAARAGVGKATIYRRWASKEELAQELLRELAAPHIAVANVDTTREELLAAVVNPMRAVTETDFGPVIRALLSQIASDPSLGDPFRSTVVQARRDEIARVIGRGIARGDIRPDADVDLATELLVGPVYFRLVFGGVLDDDFAGRVVDSVMRGYAAGAGGRPQPRSPSRE